MSAPLPRSVAWLGYGGLIPFVALTAAILVDHHHGMLWSDALIGYGALILSFVGALHWAFAMTLPDLTEQQRTARFVWSVMPALLAWPALLVDATMASFLLVPGFVAHYLQDKRLAHSQTLPDWYLPLRFHLTTVACLCLSVLGVLSFGQV